MTFYMSDDPECKPIVPKAGEGYLDLGEHPHIVDEVDDHRSPAWATTVASD